MDKANKNFLMEMATKESIKIIDSMDSEHTHGNKEKLLIKEALKMDWGMGKESGRREKQNILAAIQKV